jgi:hypothetical protein
MSPPSKTCLILMVIGEIPISILTWSREAVVAVKVGRHGGAVAKYSGSPLADRKDSNFGGQNSLGWTNDLKSIGQMSLWILVRERLVFP